MDKVPADAHRLPDGSLVTLHLYILNRIAPIRADLGYTI